MQPIQKRTLATAIAVLLAPVLPVLAQDSTLQKRLESEYALTSINAEGGVVVQGATLTLNKSGLTAGTTTGCASEYKGGKISLVSKDCRASGWLSKATSIPLLGGYVPGAGTAQAAMQTTRPFAVGEKFYISQITVADGVAFSLVSDPVEKTTYKAEIRFKARDLAQVDRMLSEVFSVTAPNNQQPVAEQVAPPQATVPDLPNLAAPAANTAAAPAGKLEMGQSIDQVIAILGQPLTVADAGSKKIYLFKDWKVTFVDGKVADVQ